MFGRKNNQRGSYGNKGHVAEQVWKKDLNQQQREKKAAIIGRARKGKVRDHGQPRGVTGDDGVNGGN